MILSDAPPDVGDAGVARRAGPPLPRAGTPGADARRVITLSAINLAAVLIAVLLPWVAGAWATTASWVWPLVVLFGLWLRLSQHKSHEADSDRRAIALCGDADALVRALVKLHVLMRLPRRWEVDFERGASHPSLAHRIQAIRAAGGGPLAATELPTGAPTVVPGRTPGTLVVFDADRIHRLEAVPPALADAPDAAPEALRDAARAVQTVAYSELTDLRVRTTLRGTPSLVATDRTGRSWTVPLRTDAVAAAQRALDAVDGQLARAPLGLVHQPALGVIAAALVGFAAVSAGGYWTVAAAALVAVIRPAPGPLAGAGAGALVASLLTLREETWVLPRGAAGVLALGVLGALTLGLAMARRHGGDARPGPTLVTVGLLGAVALAGAASLVWGAVAAGAFGLAQVARSMPSTAVALAGVAAALATLSGRWARPVAIAAAALALVLAGLGSRWVIGRVADDPLLFSGPPISTRAPSLRLVTGARLGSRGD